MIPSGPALEALQFRAAAPARPDRLPWIAVALLLLLHWAALEVLRGPPWHPPVVADRVLEVVFVPSSTVELPPPPAWPEAPRRPPGGALRATFRSEPRVVAPAPAAQSAPAESPLAPRLFGEDGQVVIPDGPPVAPAFASPRTDARRFGRRIDTLPGSDRPLADIGTVVRVAPSPEQRVMRIASFIGLSRPPTDDCRSVERRMMAETDAVARAIALEAWDRRCRGWR
jgi:hypothetical protein